MLTKKEQRLIDIIRKDAGFAKEDVSDEKLLKVSEGSYIRACAELRLAVLEIGEEILKIIRGHNVKKEKGL